LEEENAMSRKRRNFTPGDKVTILKRHLLEKMSVSELCDSYGLHPTLFHRWMKEFFENADLAFQRQKDSQRKQLEKKVAQLEGKLRQKNEVLSELMEEHVKLKKSLGEI
jgi:transposase